MPQTALISELRALFATRSRDNWVDVLAETDCCFEPLLAPEEVVGNPHEVYRQMMDPAQGEALPAEMRLPVKVNECTTSQRKPLREVSVEAVAADWLASEEATGNLRVGRCKQQDKVSPKQHLSLGFFEAFLSMTFLQA